MFALFAALSQQVAQFAIDAKSNAIAGARLSMEGTGIGKIMGDIQSKFFSLLEKCAYEGRLHSAATSCKQDWYEHMRAGFLYKVRQEGWDG